MGALETGADDGTGSADDAGALEGMTEEDGNAAADDVGSADDTAATAALDGTDATLDAAEDVWTTERTEEEDDLSVDEDSCAEEVEE